MKNISIDDLLATLTTGLKDADEVAWQEYCRAEYGALHKQGADLTKGVKISGKGDKAKGTVKGAEVKFAGHNIALAALDAATRMNELSQSTGYTLPKVDISEWCGWWKARRDAKKERAEKETAASK